MLNLKVCGQSLQKKKAKKSQVEKDLNCKGKRVGREEDTPAVIGSLMWITIACNMYKVLYNLQKILHSLSFLVLIFMETIEYH